MSFFGLYAEYSIIKKKIGRIRHTTRVTQLYPGEKGRFRQNAIYYSDSAGFSEQ